MGTPGRHVLVIGAGPAGLRAAIDLADLGARVTLVDRRPAPGGTLAQLDVQYPSVDCGACQILESVSGPPWPERRCLRTGVRHPAITTLTSTAVTGAAPRDAGFTVRLERRDGWIDADRCTGCGECAAACPLGAADEHQAGTCERRAAYRLHGLTDPPRYVIDEARCDRCGACVDACPEHAIELGRAREASELDVDAIVVATGFAPFDPARQPQWAHGRHPDVVTALELERLVRPRADGSPPELRRPSTGEPARRVAFVQCVGSRDRERPYCSAVCCMHALKEAILLRERLHVPECDVYAIDLRCTGKGYEQTLARAIEAGVRLVPARPGAVEPGERPLLRVERETDGPGLAQSREAYDLVVLSTGMVPAPGTAELAAVLGLELDAHGFVAVEPGSMARTSRPGVFVCGAAAGPSDLPWSITTASQAALLAADHSGAVAHAHAHEDGLAARAARNVPLAAIAAAPPVVPRLDEVPIVKRAIVLGAGPAGLAAARAIGRAGIETIVVERAAAPGGNLREARRLMGGGDPAALLAELLADVGALKNVELLLGWELASHRGGPGAYEATLRELATGRERRVPHGALVVATGGRELRPAGRFGHDEDKPAGPVLTQRALEALLAGGGPIPSRPGRPPVVVMIQCVGSREPGRPVCSRVCCHEAIKNALWLQERAPGARVLVLHRDLRALGYDELWYEQARERGLLAVHVPADRPPELSPRDDGATVRYHDPLLGRAVRIDADLVVLSMGIEPSLTAGDARRLGLELVEGGYAAEANAKFRPVEAARRGLLLAGAALAPVLVPEAMAQGEAAAARAVALLSRDRVAPRPGAVAYRPAWCAACGLCVAACPAGARELDADPEVGAVVHVGLCQGCGGCAAACPSGCTAQPDLDAAGVLEATGAALEDTT